MKPFAALRLRNSTTGGGGGGGSTARTITLHGPGGPVAITTSTSSRELLLPNAALLNEK